MENEIKVNEYVRMIDGLIAKIVTKDKDDHFILDRYYAGGRHLTEIEVKNDIVKHSSNLIDLIQCGDYVNGYKVVETYKDKQLSGWQVGKSKEDETWLGVVVSSKMIKEPLQEYFDNEMIKTIVTKEMMKTISYKVKE